MEGLDPLDPRDGNVRSARKAPKGLGVDAVETFGRLEDAELLVQEVRGDDSELASYLRIEERELEVGGLN